MDTPTPTVEAPELTTEEHVAAVKQHAGELAGALVNATNAGVSPALLLPELVAIFRESGLMPAGGGIPGFGG